MTHLAVEQLCVRFTQQRTGQTRLVVDQVQFSVAPGEFVSIIGPSGCGKTTILNSIAGLVPLAQGRITLGDRAVTRPGRDRAMVFQSPSLLPWRSVLRNVAYGLELQGTSRPEAEALARDYIRLVGLDGFQESYPHELSGGMQQRTNLARALAIRPQVLLLDEPLSALDAQTRELMMLELQRIWLQDRVTAVYVTHQISEALFLADRVIVMTPSPGRIREIVPVSLPRPRTLGVFRTPIFTALEDHLRTLLFDVSANGDPEPGPTRLF